MTVPSDELSVESVYDFWLSLIPQFFGQFGTGMRSGDREAAAQPPGSTLPADRSPRDGTFSPQTWQDLSRAYASMLQSTPASAWFAPWMAALQVAPADDNAGGAARGAGTPALQAMQQAWSDFAARLTGASPQSYITAFDRTFGGLADALGFGPMRKLQEACQELMAASLAQNESRATYAVLVQGAFAAGFEDLMLRLGEMAQRGERVTSVLALLRLWALSTEQAVHKVLQSERGLAATAALARAGLTHRRKLKHVASIAADALDMATRRELDEAYREIHELKRQVRRLRQSALPEQASAPRNARARKRRSS